MRRSRRFLMAALWAALLLICVFRFEWLEEPLKQALGAKNVMRLRAPLWSYALEHLQLALLSSALSTLIGLTLALLVRLPVLQEFRDPLLSGATFLQTLPSAAVLALSVPLIGYGREPVVIALVFYGLLPVVRSTIEGMEAAPRELLAVADGMGMTPVQRLLRVSWPMAFPAVLAGIRSSVLINISAATLGAAAGAGGLGVLIVNGIRSMDLVMILKGALPVSLLALLLGSLFDLLEPDRRTSQR